MKKKKRPLSPLAAAAIKITIGLLDKLLVSRIPIEDIKSDVRLRLEPVKRMITVLSDADPNNAEQIKEVWMDFLKSEEFNESIEHRVLQLIDLIEDEKVKDFVKRIILPCFATIRAVLDNEPDNVEQIRKIWSDFLTDKANTSAFLRFFVDNDAKFDEIADVVDGFMDAIAEIVKEALN